MDAEHETPSPRRVRFMMMARLVLLGVSFGLSVAALVMLVLGVLRLLGGNVDALRGAVSVLLPAGAALTAARWAIPRIDGELLDYARRAQGPAMCMPLIDLLDSPALGLRAAPFEAELVRLLGTVDEAWWQANARELREELGGAIEAAVSPSPVRPSRGTWLPALFDAMARFGRTEYLPVLERLARAGTRGSADAEVVAAAQRGAETLRERQRRDRMAATLLRPAAPPGADALLRPASVDAGDDPARLLRPAGLPDEPTADAAQPSADRGNPDAEGAQAHVVTTRAEGQ